LTYSIASKAPVVHACLSQVSDFFFARFWLCGWWTSLESPGLYSRCPGTKRFLLKTKNRSPALFLHGMDPLVSCWCCGEDVPHLSIWLGLPGFPGPPPNFFIPLGGFGRLAQMFVLWVSLESCSPVPSAVIVSPLRFGGSSL